MDTNHIKGRPLERRVVSIGRYYHLEIEGNEIHVRSHSKHAKGRLLSMFPNLDGYLRVKMDNRAHLIHWMVAEVYHGARPEGMVINHKDCDKTNNHPDNLEYVTIAENIAHSIAHGRHVASNPTRMPTYKDGRCADMKTYQHEWYVANRDRLRLASQAYYLQHREEIKARTNQYYHDHKA